MCESVCVCVFVCAFVFPLCLLACGRVKIRVLYCLYCNLCVDGVVCVRVYVCICYTVRKYVCMCVCMCFLLCVTVM